MKKAIFLDRDGVINKKRNDYVKSVEELEIFPFSSSVVKKINDAGTVVEKKRVQEVKSNFLNKYIYSALLGFILLLVVIIYFVSR